MRLHVNSCALVGKEGAEPCGVSPMSLTTCRPRKRWPGEGAELCGVSPMSLGVMFWHGDLV